MIGAIRLLTFTGARLSEIITLRWDYISEEHQLAPAPRLQDGTEGNSAERTGLGVATIPSLGLTTTPMSSAVRNQGSIS